MNLEIQGLTFDNTYHKGIVINMEKTLRVIEEKEAAEAAQTTAEAAQTTAEAAQTTAEDKKERLEFYLKILLPISIVLVGLQLRNIIEIIKKYFR